MDPLRFLGYLALGIAVGGLIVTRRGRHGVASPWLAAVACGLSAWGLYAPQRGALIAAIAVTGLGIVLPAAIFSTARRRALFGDFAGAARRADWLLRFRNVPAAARWRESWTAYDQWLHGNAASIETLIARLAPSDTIADRVQRDWLLAATRDWERARHTRSLDLQVIAECELGDVDRGAELAGRAWHRRLGLLGLTRARWLSLAPLAFAGWADTLERLMRLLALPPDVRRVWRSVAWAAAGRVDDARIAIEAMLARDASGERPLTDGVRFAAQHRLRRLPLAPVIGPAGVDVLHTARREIRAAALLRVRPTWNVPVVFLVVGLLLGGFAAQAVAGGVESVWVARSLGALVSTGGWPETPSQLIRYAGLHHGALHLIVNMIAICCLGPAIARMTGSTGFVVIFVGSVVGGGLAISYFGPAMQATIGASGGAMGLLGAFGAIALLAPSLRRTRTALVLGRVAFLFVVLEVLGDALMPQISLEGHLGGAVAGAALGALYARLRPNRPPGR